MENKKLLKIMKEITSKVAYQSFKSSVELPYILIVQVGSNNFGADNKVYKKNNSYAIELYSDDKDFDMEEKIENKLNENDIYWEKSADIRIEKENVTEVVYYIS